VTIETLPREAFRHDQLLRDGTWVVGFLADWCPFCRRFRPELEGLAGSTEFRVAVGDLTSQESPLWEDLGIEVVPAVFVFRDGRAVFRAESDLGLGLPPGTLDRARAVARSTPT